MRGKVRSCSGDKRERESQACSGHLGNEIFTTIVQDKQGALSVCQLAIVHTFQSNGTIILFLISILCGGLLIVQLMIHLLMHYWKKPLSCQLVKPCTTGVKDRRASALDIRSASGRIQDSSPGSFLWRDDKQSPEACGNSDEDGTGHTSTHACRPSVICITLQSPWISSLERPTRCSGPTWLQPPRRYFGLSGVMHLVAHLIRPTSNPPAQRSKNTRCNILTNLINEEAS
jgi:hypothetical protein